MKFILIIFVLIDGKPVEIQRQPIETAQECVLYGNLLKATVNDPTMIFKCVRNRK